VNGSNISEVAKLAGVSASTVSRVTSGNAVVKPETRQRVQEAMDTLGYKPNSAAQSLSSKRSNTIGMVVAGLDGPFYGPMIAGVESSLRARAKHLLIASGSGNTESEVEAIEFLLGRQVDGLILLTEWLEQRYLAELLARIPVYMINQYYDGMDNRVMLLDDLDGGYRATRYLLDRGHRAIACISAQEFKKDANDRVAGYKVALREAGIPVLDDLIARTSFEVQGGIDGMDQLSKRGQNFTAVVAGNDESAVGVYSWAKDHGLRIPDDISVIGYDDILLARVLTPPLTTMHAPNFDMAKRAADSAFNEIYRKRLPLGGNFKTTLIERESVATLI
jgi:LacI family transcriptional regulator